MALEKDRGPFQPGSKTEYHYQKSNKDKVADGVKAILYTNSIAITVVVAKLVRLFVTFTVERKNI